MAIGALVVYSAIGLIFPLVIVQLLTSVLEVKDEAALTTLATTLIVLFLFQSAFIFVNSYLLSWVGERVILDIRTQLYRHLQTLSLAFFENRRVGELLSRFSADVAQMRGVVTANITSFLSQLITLIGSIVLIFVLNPSLTLFILILAPALVAVAIIFGRPLQRLSTKVNDELASSSVIAEETLQGVRVVKSFAREPYEVQRYTAAMSRTFGASIRQAIYRAAFGSVMAFLGFGAIAAILWYSGREVINDRMSIAAISGFLIYAINIAASLGGLAGLYAEFRSALGAIRRVFEILDTQPTVKDAPNAIALPAVEGGITLDHVSFSYDDKTEVLHEIDLNIKPGEIIALVGPSGAGKSTLFNLIPRFYDPTEGQVAIDGYDLRTVRQDSLHQQIGLVPQETLLFGGSILENIQYGRLEATEAEVIEAAKAANAHDFITALPEGYKTLVGERGIKLSGGQRQRVTIARAILKDPRILLLDEATSALDSESENLVQEALERLMQDRTTVIIAHRLSTVRIAHRIVVLDNGRIVEIGGHTDLLARGGLYAKLYNAQFRQQESQQESGERTPV